LPDGDALWYFLTHPVEQIQQMLIDFATNPAAAVVTWGPLLFWLGYQAFFQPFGWGFWGVVLSSPAWLPAVALASLGLLGLINLAGLPDLAPVAEAPAADAGTQHSWPAAGLGSTVASPAAAPASATTASAAAGAAAAPAAPAATGLAYAVTVPGDSGPSFAPTVGGRTGIKAPAATIPAAGAAAATRAQSRARRRRRAELHDHADEFLDLDSDFGVTPDYGTEASDQGAGALGFAGTAHKEAVLQAAGLTALAGDEFGGGPRMPMVPGTWDGGPERGGDDGFPRNGQ
jgi:PPE-repeat protein